LVNGFYMKKGKALPNLQLAKTCSTCKFAIWGESDISWGGKKQGGMCCLNCDPKPQKPKQWGMWYHGTSLRDLAKKGQLPTEDAFVKQGIEGVYYSCRTEKEQEQDKRKKELCKEFQRFMADFNWWQNNYSKTTLCHRQTVCEHWEEGNKNRESFARKIVAGKAK